MTCGEEVEHRAVEPVGVLDLRQMTAPLQGQHLRPGDASGQRVDVAGFAQGILGARNEQGRNRDAFVLQTVRLTEAGPLTEER